MKMSALLVSLFAIGCNSSYDHRLDGENVRRIKVGATKEEVVQIMGEPRVAGSERWVYTSRPEFMRCRSAKILFTNDVVLTVEHFEY